VNLLAAFDWTLDELLFIPVVRVVLGGRVLQLDLLDLYLVEACFLDTRIRYMLNLCGRYAKLK